MRRIIVAPLVAAMALAAGCSRQNQENKAQASMEKPKPLAVRVGAAETRKVEQAIFVTGALHPDESVTASAEVAGRISAIHADFGQSVRKGQVLAELDKREFVLQLQRSRAALAQALARVGLQPGQEDKLPDTTPAIRLAAAQFEDARFKYENAARLVKSGDISQERFTELEKACFARQAALDAARDELRTQLAGIQALEAEVRLSEKRLGDATVRAPFDGTVASRSASPGQYMKENTPILTVVKTAPLRLRVEIPESAAAEVRTGTSLTFVTDAASGVEFRAMVTELNPSLDPRSRSLTVEARLLGSDGRLRPGMFVQVRLVTMRDAEIVMVPREALYSVAGLTKVFVVHGTKVAEHKLAPGRQLDGWVEVPGVIRAGDKVAVSNLGALVEGALVQVQE